MKNSTIRDFIAVLMMQLILTLPFYTAGVYGFTISNVKVSATTSNSATIEWQTDNLSSGKVRYGNTSALGYSQNHDSVLLNHSVALVNGIVSGTSYFFSVESTDLAGNIATDNNSNNFYKFTTSDITPPPRVTGLLAASITTNSVSLKWDGVVSSDFGHYTVYRNSILISNTTSNSFNDQNLNSSTSYRYNIAAVDKSGNEALQSDTLIVLTLLVDSVAPSISALDVITLSDSTARVNWLTDENATSAIYYGINSTPKSRIFTDLVTNHTITIDGLQKNSVYNFFVSSCDSSSNCANSTNSTFISGQDSGSSFLNLTIPRYVNRRAIDLIGSTKPFSQVSLFLNNMNLPLKSFGSNEIGSSGRFSFNQIQLLKDNKIKIAVTDRLGKLQEKTFDVSVDTDAPAVQISDVPSLVPYTQISINGTVNEPVTIKVFVDAIINQPPTPPKIIGLNVTKIGQNSIEIHWNESNDSDFSHYVVYRDDASSIAVTKPSSFNLFIDALVDSAKSYTYEVSQVNIFANEGPKSDSVTATTLSGGATLNLKPPQVDILEDFRKPIIEAESTGKIDLKINLDKGDGSYNLKVVFTDRADNVLTLEKTVTLDSTKPTVKITSPASGSLVYENVANEVDVIGKTKPNARVHLFVDRTPLGFSNDSYDISGLPNEIQDVPEARLDARCRSSVSASICRTGADFSVDADGDGNFIFEKVDLTALAGGASRLREVSPTNLRDTVLNPEGDIAKRANLLVIATDKIGQRGFATQSVSIGTCWSGNQSWDIIPLSMYQSPTLLSPERFAEGTETIYFYFNYSYIGRGTDAKITSISMSKACGTRELLDSRFNVSCQILPSGNSPMKLNKEGTLSYSAITLSRFPGMDQFLENDWKSFFNGIKDELSFPFKVRITYKHSVIDDSGVQREITETQTTCEQVSYVLDKSVIDPRKVLPDFLLYDFVDFLQGSINTLTSVQEKVDQVLDYVAIGCLTSFALNFAVETYRRWVTFWDEKSYTFLKDIKDVAKVGEIFSKSPLKTSSDDDRNYCENIIKNIVRDRGSFQMKFMTDLDLKKCFPSSDSAWNAEAKVYSLFRWSCDRVFGHAAPAAWTEKKNDDELLARVQSGEGCAIDQSVRGTPLRVQNCVEFEKSYPKYKTSSYGIDKKCTLITTGKNQEAVFTVDEPVSDSANLYRLSHIPSMGAFVGTNIYAIKKDETNYFTAQYRSCEELCTGGRPVGSSGEIELNGQKIAIDKNANDKSGSEAIPYCTTVDKCRSWNANKEIIDTKGTKHKIVSATTWGYTSKISSKDQNPCFYDAGKSVNVVSDAPSQREECCCINSKETKITTHYYQPDDKPLYETQTPVHESKSVTGMAPQAQENDPQGYSDMQWSYRYWKEKYEAKGTAVTGTTVSTSDTLRDAGKGVSDTNPIHSEYNPKRYIGGRDQSSCLGQNSWYDAFSSDPKVLTIDPFKDHLAAVQCVHIAGISNRLQFIRNLMTSMSTCLIQVRTTGRGDAGACKELFTQYLCGSIWQIIRAFIDGCAPVGAGVNLGGQSDDSSIIDYLKTGFKGVHQSLSDTQAEIRSEYGNAKLNELLGTGEESVARKICLGAFGYDWEINVRNLIDAAYATPFATLVQPITRSREFLTVDPISVRPRYEYRASWIINPGCDFERYDVYLSCVGRKQLDQYPNSVNCGAVGAPSIAYTGPIGTSTAYNQCDCINLPDEKLGPLVYSGTRLKQNVLEDKSILPGQRVQDSNYRYDHLKFVLRTDRKILPNIKPNCFPQGYDDGVFYFPLTDKTAKDIADCTVDYLSGVYSCAGGATFLGRKGTAEILEVTINGQNANLVKELSLGDNLEVAARVSKSGRDKCLKVSLAPDAVQAVVVGITLNGTNDIAPITFGKLTIQGRSGQVIANGITNTLVMQNNQDPVIINVRAFDNGGDPNNKNVYSRDDRLQIDGIDVDFTKSDVQGNDKIKIIVKNPNLTDKTEKPVISVEKENAKIEIRDIQYTSTQLGSYEYQGSITINPTQQSTGVSSQTKTVTLELFNTKENSDSYGDNQDNCDFNDKIGDGKKYSITVSQTKGVDASQLGPVIQNPQVNPRSQFIGQNIVVLARITHSSGVPDARISVTKPGGDQMFTEPQVMSKSGDNFELSIPTTGMEKGKYSGNIKATSGSQTTSNKAFEFELKEQT